MTHNILVVDDEPKLCDLLASALGQNDVQVFVAGNGLHALKVLEQEDIDLVISDWRMPGMDGPALLAEIKVRYPHVPVIVMTAYSTVKNAVQSMRNGAYDYIAKPFDIDELDITVAKALQFRDIMRDNARMRAELDEHAQFDSLVGDSPAFRKVLQAVDSVRDSSATILLTGESGTGKEMVARAIHKHGSRADKPFVAVNCAAIPEGLLESEMFGHRKGAFTGAVADRVGRFQQADKGTLFLDEVGDMPLALQAKILRALQERVIEPVGDPRERKVDVRVIAATNKNLLEAVANKEFREDLYYRLNVFPIEMAPLRERVEDIPLLMNELISRMEHEKRGSIRFNSAAIMSLCRHGWPGNVRELANLVERMAIMHPYGVIGVVELPKKFRYVDDEDEQLVDSLRSDMEERVAINGHAPDFSNTAMLPPEGLDLKDYLGNLEQGLIQQALDDANGIVARAAERLRIRRTTLVEKMRKYGMSRKEGDEQADD